MVGLMRRSHLPPASAGDCTIGDMRHARSWAWELRTHVASSATDLAKRPVLASASTRKSRLPSCGTSRLAPRLGGWGSPHPTDERARSAPARIQGTPPGPNAGDPLGDSRSLRSGRPYRCAASMPPSDLTSTRRPGSFASRIVCKRPRAPALIPSSKGQVA